MNVNQSSRTDRVGDDSLERSDSIQVMDAVPSAFHRQHHEIRSVESRRLKASPERAVIAVLASFTVCVAVATIVRSSNSGTNESSLSARADGRLVAATGSLLRRLHERMHLWNKHRTALAARSKLGSRAVFNINEQSMEIQSMINDGQMKCELT